MLVRGLVERTGIRAERALASLDAAIEEELEVAGRITLARVAAAFDTALRDLADRADERLRQLDRGVERSLFANLAVATAKADPPADAAEADDLGAIEDDVLLSDALILTAVKRIEALTQEIRREGLSAFEKAETAYAEVQDLRAILNARIADLRRRNA